MKWQKARLLHRGSLKGWTAGREIWVKNERPIVKRTMAPDGFVNTPTPCFSTNIIDNRGRLYAIAAHHIELIAEFADEVGVLTQAEFASAATTLDNHA